MYRYRSKSVSAGMVTLAYTPVPLERLRAKASVMSFVSWTYPVYVPGPVRFTAVAVVFPASFPLPASFCPVPVEPPPPDEEVENVVMVKV